MQILGPTSMESGHFVKCLGVNHGPMGLIVFGAISSDDYLLINDSYVDLEVISQPPC